MLGDVEPSIQVGIDACLKANRRDIAEMLEDLTVRYRRTGKDRVRLLPPCEVCSYPLIEIARLRFICDAGIATSVSSERLAGQECEITIKEHLNKLQEFLDALLVSNKGLTRLLHIYADECAADSE